MAAPGGTSRWNASARPIVRLDRSQQRAADLHLPHRAGDEAAPSRPGPRAGPTRRSLRSPRSTRRRSHRATAAARRRSGRAGIRAIRRWPARRMSRAARAPRRAPARHRPRRARARGRCRSGRSRAGSRTAARRRVADEWNTFETRTEPAARQVASRRPVIAPGSSRARRSSSVCAPTNPAATPNAPSHGLNARPKPRTSPGNVAAPTAWVRNESRRSTIQHPSSPAGTESSSTSSERPLHEGVLERVAEVAPHRTRIVLNIELEVKPRAGADRGAYGVEVRQSGQAPRSTTSCASIAWSTRPDSAWIACSRRSSSNAVTSPQRSQTRWW